MIFCYFQKLSCIFLQSQIVARHLASLIHQSAVPYGRFAFLHFFQKSCSKCFKKRFKSRSRWRHILGLNPSFGGFFSQNFQNLKKTENHKVQNAGSETNAWTGPQSPAKIDYFRRRREGGGLGFSQPLQKRRAIIISNFFQKHVFLQFERLG